MDETKISLHKIVSRTCDRIRPKSGQPIIANFMLNPATFAAIDHE